MKGWIPRSVDDLIDKLDKSKGSKSYNLGDQKDKDSEIKNKKDGETWTDLGTEYLIKDGIVRTKTSIMLEDELKDVKLPRFCPICEKQMKHQLDVSSWWINKKCFDCFIAEDHKLRVKDNYLKIAKVKNIKETIALLKGELSMYLELADSVGDDLNLVQNSEGVIDT